MSIAGVTQEADGAIFEELAPIMITIGHFADADGIGKSSQIVNRNTSAVRKFSACALGSSDVVANL